MCDPAGDLAMAFEGPVTVPVEYLGQVTRGFIAHEEDQVPDGMGRAVKVRRHAVTIPNGALTGLARDEAIVVDGLEYRIRDTFLREDGAVIDVLLAGAGD